MLARRSGLCGLVGAVGLLFGIVGGFVRDELARLSCLRRLLERPLGLELEFASPATRRKYAEVREELLRPMLCLCLSYSSYRLYIYLIG